MSENGVELKFEFHTKLEKQGVLKFIRSHMFDKAIVLKRKRTFQNAEKEVKSQVHHLWMSSDEKEEAGRSCNSNVQ